MMKTLLMCVVLLALAAPTFAQPYPPQMDLTWTDCTLGPFAVDLNNPCTFNFGDAGTLIGSFAPPGVVPFYESNIAIIDLQTIGPTLSPWWHLESGGCRDGVTMVSGDFTTGPFSCSDFWKGQALAAMYYVTPSPSLSSPNSARLATGVAIQTGSGGPIDNTKMWYAFLVALSNNRSVGTGSCAGCMDGACIVLNEMRLGQPAPTPDVILTSGPQQYVTYRGGAGPAYPCPQSTPTHRNTWGSLKALYR